MGKISPDNEILDFAIAKELEAHKFYLSMAEIVEDPAIKQALEVFAGEELEHKAKLEMEYMKNGIVIDTALKNITFQISDYVISDTPTIDMDYRDLLQLCIEKEDASFRLYVDLLVQVEDPAAKETLLSIIEEEVKHKLRFEAEYNNLFKKI